MSGIADHIGKRKWSSVLPTTYNDNLCDIFLQRFKIYNFNDLIQHCMGAHSNIYF